MGFEAFGAGEGGDGRGEFAEGGLGQVLHGDHFQVVGDGEAAAQAGGAAGGEDVVGAGCVVAGGFGTEGADEDAAGVADAGEQRLVGDAEVLGGEAIGDFDGFVETAYEDDGGVLRDRFGARRRRWEGSAS